MVMPTASLTPRRLLLQALLAACALPLGAQAADPYPTKPIRVIVPAAAGGNLDLTARVIGQKMAEVLGQPLVIQNIPTMLLATRTAAAAPPDGYTLYTGLVAPAGMPKDVVARLHEALAKALASPELRERFSKDGTELSTGETPEQYTEFLRQESTRNAKVVSDAGIQKQ